MREMSEVLHCTLASHIDILYMAIISLLSLDRVIMLVAVLAEIHYSCTCTADSHRMPSANASFAKPRDNSLVSSARQVKNPVGIILFL